jgi:hypothetical protein
LGVSTPGDLVMRDTSAEKCFVCSCGWISAHRYPMWRQLPASCRCPQCGGDAKSVVLLGPDHPSQRAVDRAWLRWALNATTTEAGTP